MVCWSPSRARRVIRLPRPALSFSIRGRTAATTRATARRSAQGEYFRQFDDAGFVADSAERLTACRAIEDSGQEIVAPFHSHRRQPANFSLIDYRLHNPAFAWHLIISLRDPRRPVLQPFGVAKEPSDFGINDQDACQGSELAYPGPEVAPLALVARGAQQAIRRLTGTVHPTTA